MWKHITRCLNTSWKLRVAHHLHRKIDIMQMVMKIRMMVMMIRIVIIMMIMVMMITIMQASLYSFLVFKFKDFSWLFLTFHDHNNVKNSGNDNDYDNGDNRNNYDSHTNDTDHDDKYFIDSTLLNNSGAGYFSNPVNKFSLPLCGIPITTSSNPSKSSKFE